MKDKVLIIVTILLSIVFFDVNGMNCSEQCKYAQDFKECLRWCQLRNTNLTEKEARREWNRRYPCSPGEESDCYFPYRDDYKKGIKRDDKLRARKN